MKTLNLMFTRYAGRLALASLAFGVSLTGCGRQDAKASPVGKAKETCAYWEAFNKAAVAGTGIEALQQKTYQADVGLPDTYAVLEDVIAGEQERNRTIAALPVLHVDPGLTAYALQFARCRSDLAGTMREFVLLLKKQEEITSTPALGLGLFFNLLNHSDDKEDGIFWRAMLDEGRQTADQLQALKEPGRALEAKAAKLRNTFASLNAEEMNVRIKLSQRFNKEFPPMQTYATASTPADRSLSRVQVMETLIGQQIGEWPNRWTFEQKEFVSFDILKVTNQTDVLTDYEVKTHVKGIPSGNEHDFNLSLTYGRLYTRWKLIQVRVLEKN